MTATAFGLVGSGWAAVVAYGARWPSGSDIPVVAGVFAAPLAAHLLVRGAEHRDRRLLWSLAAAALPLYLTALWAVAETTELGSVDPATLRRALAGGSLVSAFAWCGLAAGAAILAAEARRPPPGRRVLLLGASTLPAAAAFAWALDRLPLSASIGPALAALAAALVLPWSAGGVDRASTALTAVISAVALFGCMVTGALGASVTSSATAAASIDGLAIEASVAVLRFAVPAAALLPVLALVLAVRALHGPLPAARTAAQAGLALAVCTLPLVLQALALRETRPAPLDGRPPASEAAPRDGATERQGSVRPAS